MTAKYRFTFLVLMQMLLTGCGVSSFKAENWIPPDPNDLYRAKNLAVCHQAAQHAEPINTPESNSATAGATRRMIVDKTLLISCMEKKGYKLREITDTELLMNMATSPIVLPLKLLGQDFDDTY